MSTDLKPHIAAVLAGSSMTSEAKKAGVATTTLQRLVIKHPDYEKVKAAGLIRKPGLPGLTEVDADTLSAAVEDVYNGLTALEAAHKHGLAASTVTKAFHKAHPDKGLVRGGAGLKRDVTSRLAQAQAKVERCRKAFDQAMSELQSLSGAAQ